MGKESHRRDSTLYQRYLSSPRVGWMQSSVGVWWGRENCRTWCLEGGNVSKVSPGIDWSDTIGSGIPAHRHMVAWWLTQPTRTAEALVRIPGEHYLFPSFRNEISATNGTLFSSILWNLPYGGE